MDGTDKCPPEEQTKKLRLINYTLELSNTNPCNLSETSLDRDPYTVKWEIELETYNKSFFTLLRTNLINLITEREHAKYKELLIENKEPAPASDTTELG